MIELTVTTQEATAAEKIRVFLYFEASRIIRGIKDISSLLSIVSK
jgi:hypothetical protein